MYGGIFMNDIAIYFEKYDLGDDRFVFKPTSIIRGTYDKENNLFETDHGTICYSIVGDEYEANDFFHCPTSMNELKKAFGEQNSEEALLTEYFNLCKDYCYIGYFDGEVINVKQMSFDDIEDFSNIETTFIELDYDDELGKSAKFTFNLESIKDLRNSKDITEVHSKIDNIIGLYSQIVGNPEGIEEDG